MEEILKHISQLKADHDRVLIAIDGYGGAGKSSLARSLVREFEDARHIEFDWFHRPRCEIKGDERFDTPRFRDEVIQPFLARAEEIKIRKYNWGYLANKPEALESETMSLAGASMLVVEGL